MKCDEELQSEMCKMFDLAWKENMEGRATELTKKITMYLPSVRQQLDFYSGETEYVMELLQSAKEEMEKYEKESEFNKGALFAYRYVETIMRHFKEREEEIG